MTIIHKYFVFVFSVYTLLCFAISIYYAIINENTNAIIFMVFFLLSEYILVIMYKEAINHNENNIELEPTNNPILIN